MPIPNVTPYPGELPTLADPVTFDARMTSFATWFEAFAGEIFATVGAMNTALNDNGTVLDATAEATRRATNAVVPALTSGSASAYTVAATVTVPALAVGEPVAVRVHLASTGAATLNVNGLGAVAIRKFDAAGSLVALAAGDFAAFDEHVLVYDGTYWVLQTQPLREIITGAALAPLAAQAGDFDDLVEGGRFDIDGDWTNGPLGAPATEYNALAVVDRRRTTDGAYLVQEVVLIQGGSLQKWQRVGTGAPIVWSAWKLPGSPLNGPPIAAGAIAVWRDAAEYVGNGNGGLDTEIFSWRFVQSGSITFRALLRQNDTNTPDAVIYVNGVEADRLVAVGTGDTEDTATVSFLANDVVTIEFNLDGAGDDNTWLSALEMRTDGSPIYPEPNTGAGAGVFLDANFT